MACDLAKSGYDILMAYKEFSPLTQPLELFPSANSSLTLNKRKADLSQREIQLNSEETGLNKNPASTVGFGQETNIKQENQLQLSEGLFSYWRDSLPAFFSLFFFSSFFLSPLFCLGFFYNFSFSQSLLLADLLDMMPSQAALLILSAILGHGRSGAPWPFRGSSELQATGCSWGHSQWEGPRLGLLHLNPQTFTVWFKLSQENETKGQTMEIFYSHHQHKPISGSFLKCPRRPMQWINFLFFLPFRDSCLASLVASFVFTTVLTTKIWA